MRVASFLNSRDRDAWKIRNDLLYEDLSLQHFSASGFGGGLAEALGYALSSSLHDARCKCRYGWRATFWKEDITLGLVGEAAFPVSVQSLDLELDQWWSLLDKVKVLADRGGPYVQMYCNYRKNEGKGERMADSRREDSWLFVSHAQRVAYLRPVVLCPAVQKSV